MTRICGFIILAGEFTSTFPFANDVYDRNQKDCLPILAMDYDGSNFGLIMTTLPACLPLPGAKDRDPALDFPSS
jgi:hypothetical protein